MAVSNSIHTTVEPDPSVAAVMPRPKSQPLWRFALVGLGPLSALGLFALLVALLQRMA